MDLAHDLDIVLEAPFVVQPAHDMHLAQLGPDLGQHLVDVME